MVAIDRLVLAGAPSAARTSVSRSKPQQPMGSQQGELAWPFASGPVGMHSSPPLIGMYRSLPSSNRPDSISLVRFLTVSSLWCMACGGFLAMSTIEFANALGSQRSCDRRAAADLLQSASRILPAPPHTIRQNISPWKRDIFLPSRERNGDCR
jgi:hypothetical protein